MIRTSIDPRIALRHPVVNAALEAIEHAERVCAGNPCDHTRYELARAQGRLVTICRVLGVA